MGWKQLVWHYEAQHGRNNEARRFVNSMIRGGVTPPRAIPFGPHNSRKPVKRSQPEASAAPTSTQPSQPTQPSDKRMRPEKQQTFMEWWHENRGDGGGGGEKHPSVETEFRNLDDTTPPTAKNTPMKTPEGQYRKTTIYPTRAPPNSANSKYGTPATEPGTPQSSPESFDSLGPGDHVFKTPSPKSSSE